MTRSRDFVKSGKWPLGKLLNIHQAQGKIFRFFLDTSLKGVKSKSD